MARTTRSRPRSGSSEEIQVRARALSSQWSLNRESLTPASHSETLGLDLPQHRVTFILSIRLNR